MTSYFVNAPANLMMVNFVNPIFYSFCGGKAPQHPSQSPSSDPSSGPTPGPTSGPTSSRFSFKAGASSNESSPSVFSYHYMNQEGNVFANDILSSMQQSRPSEEAKSNTNHQSNVNGLGNTNYQENGKSESRQIAIYSPACCLSDVTSQQETSSKTSQGCQEDQTDVSTLVFPPVSKEEGSIYGQFRAFEGLSTFVSSNSSQPSGGIDSSKGSTPDAKALPQSFQENKSSGGFSSNEPEDTTAIQPATTTNGRITGLPSKRVGDNVVFMLPLSGKKGLATPSVVSPPNQIGKLTKHPLVSASSNPITPSGNQKCSSMDISNSIFSKGNTRLFSNQATASPLLSKEISNENTPSTKMLGGKAIPRGKPHKDAASSTAFWKRSNKVPSNDILQSVSQSALNVIPPSTRSAAEQERTRLQRSTIHDSIAARKAKGAFPFASMKPLGVLPRSTKQAGPKFKSRKLATSRFSVQNIFAASTPNNAAKGLSMEHSSRYAIGNKEQFPPSVLGDTFLAFRDTCSDITSSKSPKEDLSELFNIAKEPPPPDDIGKEASSCAYYAPDSASSSVSNQLQSHPSSDAKEPSPSSAVKEEESKETRVPLLLSLPAPLATDKASGETRVTFKYDPSKRPDHSIFKKHVRNVAGPVTDELARELVGHSLIATRYYERGEIPSIYKTVFQTGIPKHDLSPKDFLMLRSLIYQKHAQKKPWGGYSKVAKPGGPGHEGTKALKRSVVFKESRDIRTYDSKQCPEDFVNEYVAQGLGKNIVPDEEEDSSNSTLSTGQILPTCQTLLGFQSLAPEQYLGAVASQPIAADQAIRMKCGVFDVEQSGGESESDSEPELSEIPPGRYPKLRKMKQTVTGKPLAQWARAKLASTGPIMLSRWRPARPVKHDI